MQSCLNELSLLRDLSDEIVKGRDPNLSVLLGVRDMSLLQEKVGFCCENIRGFSRTFIMALFF